MSRASFHALAKTRNKPCTVGCWPSHRSRSLKALLRVLSLIAFLTALTRLPSPVKLCDEHNLLCSLRTECNRESHYCHIRRSHTPTNATTRILSYNTHPSCTANLRTLLARLSPSVALDTFDPAQLAGYGMTRPRAWELVEAGHAAWVCRGYALVVVADTVPHARALLESLALAKGDARRCEARILVEMTNRFDWRVPLEELDEYYALIRRLWERGDAVFVANNVFDEAYFGSRLGVDVKNSVRVLRPLGVGPARGARYPWDLPRPSLSRFAAQKHFSNVYNDLATNYSIPLTVFPFGHRYGGATNLLRFKAFLDFPYQFSIMKLYENIAAGVPALVPSPQFLEYLDQTGIHSMLNVTLLKQIAVAAQSNTAQARRRAVPGFPTWSAYTDYYAPEFAPFLYYFHSFDELKAMAGLPWGVMDWKKVRLRGPEFSVRHSEEVFQGWREVFESLGVGEFVE